MSSRAFRLLLRPSSSARYTNPQSFTHKVPVLALASSPTTTPSRLQYRQDVPRTQRNCFSTTKMSSFATPSSDPPEHEMKYYPAMTTALPSKSGEFRRVLHTGLYSQVVLMTIPVGGDIGEEVHTVDQILTFTAGMGLAQVGSREQTVQAGDMVIVPAGTRHQFLNKGSTPLVLYTVYSPAEHKATTVHATKEEGERAEAEGRDEPPEWSQRSKAENERLGLVKPEGQ